MKVMGPRNCPECGAPVQPTDTHCMDCGVNLLEARAKIERQAMESRRISPSAARAPIAGAAASGRAAPGETSDETRLRIFDQHEAEKLKGERITAFVSGALAGLAFIVLLVVGLSQIEAGGGLGALRTISAARVRSLGFMMLGEDEFLGAWLLALSVSALLCAAGQIIRGTTATQSIRAVEGGEKPVIVGISSGTQAGIMLFALLCPVLGLVVGIIMKLGRDEQTKSLGGIVIWLNLALMALLLLNYLWGLAARLHETKPPEPHLQEETLLPGLLRMI